MSHPVTKSASARHLEVYEPWQADHIEAMKCYALESWLQEGVSVFNMLVSDGQTIRSCSYVGLIPRDESEDLHVVLREQYTRWLWKARTGLADLERCEKLFGEVKHAEQFRKAIRDAETLAKMQPPTLAALRAISVGWAAASA